MKSTGAPAMAFIQVPSGERDYFLTPFPPGIYIPAIFNGRGVIRPSFIFPDELSAGAVTAVGSLKACNRLRDLQGIRAALGIMGEVWNGILDAHHGSRDDLPRQRDLAKALGGASDAAFALIEKSGKLGKGGVPKQASLMMRNVMALAHWRFIWQLRKIGKSRLLEGKPKPGALDWAAAAALINLKNHEAFPHWSHSQVKDFTARSLEDLFERNGLSSKVEV